MKDISNLAALQQLLEAIERDVQSAQKIIQQLVGEVPEAGADLEKEQIVARAKGLSVLEGGKIIEGVFDGQNMVGPDSRVYPVPANYASKSKLVEGDVLKLTISNDGSFIYKQIGPVERKRVPGILVLDEKGDYKVIAEEKSYRVLLASLTYYKAEPGDEVILLLPIGQETSWAAVENVIKKGASTLGSVGPQYENTQDLSEEPLLNPDETKEKQVRILSDEGEDY